jgi:hypothetical protein
MKKVATAALAAILLLGADGSGSALVAFVMLAGALARHRRRCR